jgi:hypothetical protein
MAWRAIFHGSLYLLVFIIKQAVPGKTQYYRAFFYQGVPILSKILDI